MGAPDGDTDVTMVREHDGSTLASIAVDAKTQVVVVGGTIAMTEARTLESQVFAGPPVCELVATSLLVRLVHVTTNRESALALVRGPER